MKYKFQLITTTVADFKTLKYNESAVVTVAMLNTAFKVCTEHDKVCKVIGGGT